MKRMILPAVVSLAYALSGGLALAEDTDELLTMTLIDDLEAQLPEAVTRDIPLPESMSEQGRASSERGIETANEARLRRLQGLETASDARERGREFGEDMAEAARERRENVGREELELPARPEVPDSVPTPPVTPPAGPPGS